MNPEEWVPNKAYQRKWRETRRRCRDCADFLGHLTYGWGLPFEGWRGPQARHEFLSMRRRSSWGRVPTVRTPDGERELRPDDSREVWGRAGLEDHVLDPLFNLSDRGRNREHRYLTPAKFHDILDNVTDWLGHLGAGSVEDVSDHLEAVFGPESDWPPHLPALFDALEEEWAYKGRNRTAGEWERDRKGVARRILRSLPIEADIRVSYTTEEVEPQLAPPPDGGPLYKREKHFESVTYRPCPFSEDYLKGLSRPWRRPDEEE